MSIKKSESYEGLNIVASIEARMHSTRLPGKVLEEVCGKPVLEHIVERINRSRHVSSVVIATSTSSADDVIEEFANKKNISVYRGSEDDVLRRLVDTHRSKKTNIVVEITGDSPFVDPHIIDETIELFLSSDCDYVSNTLIRTYPIGIRSQVFRLSLLEECERLSTDISDREHVTTFICKNEKNKYKLVNLKAPEEFNIPTLRLTLDYPEDLEVTRIIYDNLYSIKHDFGLIDVVNFLKDNPDVVDINKNCKQYYKAGA